MIVSPFFLSLKNYDAAKTGRFGCHFLLSACFKKYCLDLRSCRALKAKFCLSARFLRITTIMHTFVAPFFQCFIEIFQISNDQDKKTDQYLPDDEGQNSA